MFIPFCCVQLCPLPLPRPMCGGGNDGCRLLTVNDVIMASGKGGFHFLFFCLSDCSSSVYLPGCAGICQESWQLLLLTRRGSLFLANGRDGDHHFFKTIAACCWYSPTQQGRAVALIQQFHACNAFFFACFFSLTLCFGVIQMRQACQTCTLFGHCDVIPTCKVDY